MKYITADGTEMLDYRKAWTAEKLDIVMQEVSNQVVLDEHATPEINLNEEEAIQDIKDGDTNAN